MQPSDLIPTTEAARILGISPRRVRVLCAEGRLVAIRFGSTYAVTRASVEGFERAKPHGLTKPRRSIKQPRG